MFEQYENFSDLFMDGASLKITEMMAPSLVGHPEILATAAIYMVLFLIGICGNTSMLTVLVYVHRALAHAAQRRIQSSHAQGTLVLITALCCADFLVNLTIPVSVADMLIGHWGFGTVFCKIYWGLEGTGKVVSSFILVAMSFERYIAVCHPSAHRFKWKKTIYIILAVILIIALGLIVPLPINANVIVVQRYSPVPVGDEWVSFVRKKS